MLHYNVTNYLYFCATLAQLIITDEDILIPENQLPTSVTFRVETVTVDWFKGVPDYVTEIINTNLRLGKFKTALSTLITRRPISITMLNNACITLFIFIF